MSTDASSVAITNGLDTWNRPRSAEELRTFIELRHDRLPDDIDIE